MRNGEASVENPFPAIAVTTFGVRSEVAAEFSYMHRTRQNLVNYLKDYPSSGGALALSGGHGSGKTFLLNWLSNEAAAIKTRRSQTVYAKSDNESVPDVYRQFLRSITRNTLIEVTRDAVRNIGKGIAGAAQATKQASLEIESTGTLQSALDEKLFDANELYLLLKKELERIGVNPAISGRVAFAIGILEHPELGETAFSWLTGGEPQFPKGLPIQDSLWPKDSTDAADIATSALECIAGLYRLAEIALILVLDQMENFIPGGSLTSTHASLLKKLVEQVSGQGALLLMAGTPLAWDRLPRDVGPRLMNRTPLLIGSLNTKEVALLLGTYLRGRPGFKGEAVETIRELSGGNAREILRIAHHVFAKTEGAVSDASSELLVRAAQESGSLADRVTLALQMIDLAVERSKLSGYSSRTSGGRRIDRLVEDPYGASLAIVVLASPDARAEAEDARNVTALRQELSSLPNPTDLLIVTVGYSSSRVRAIVGEVSRVIELDENGFQSEIAEELRRLSAPSIRDAKRNLPEQSVLSERLKKLDDRLARIETTRAETDRETAEHLVRGSAELAEGERLATEAKTRHELRFGLDELHEALTINDNYLERRTLRGLLVANEANVKDATFDYLGTIYLDVLDSVQMVRPDSDDDMKLLKQYSLLRSDLIRTMRTKLSSWKRRYFDVRSPYVFGLSIGVFGVLYTGGFLLFSASARGYSDFGAIAISLIVGAVLGGVSFFVGEVVTAPERRYRYFARKLDELRSLASERGPSSLPP